MAKRNGTAKEFRRVLNSLIKRMEVVFDSAEYKSAFVLSLNHGLPYTGPTFERELKKAKKLLLETK